jgi:hypothetical protein
MSEYRNKTSGEVLSQGQVRAQHPNTSLPRVWTSDTLAFLNVDPVLGGAQPTPSVYQRVERDGVEQIGSNWHEKWSAVEMFADTSDKDGVTTTKAEHEAAYQTTLDAALATTERAKRDALLAATDYLALSDTTLSSEMTTYRQQLREVPQQSEFPNTISWPTKP